MKKSLIMLVVLIMFASTAAGIIAWRVSAPDTPANEPEMSKFASAEEFIEAFKTGQESFGGYRLDGGISTMAASNSAEAKGDYSQTNVQVAGVDEVDIVKCDGEFIYTLSQNTVNIVAASPPENALLLSRIDFEQGLQPQGLFVQGDRLAVMGSSYYPYDESEDRITPRSATVFVRIFDIRDRREARLLRTIEYEGAYSTSRMINDNVHLVVATYPYYATRDSEDPAWEDIVPGYREYTNDESMAFRPACDWSQVECFDREGFHSFVSVISFSLAHDGRNPNRTVISGYSSDAYASLENLYITSYRDSYDGYWGTSRTNISKFKLEGPSATLVASGEVPGTILNQFSMDEEAGYFRIATMMGYVSQGQSDAQSNVYILDSDLNMTGKLEGLGIGEQMHSARFMGKRAYLVTFKKVDPFFVLDLSNPRDPKVLGTLKIPGYSDYLHPYDENHVIGVGKDTVAAEEGNFAWYQGIKIAIFDVTDVANPKEMYKADIGDRGTDSYALSDHKAFLFDREKGLLALPVNLAELTPEQKASSNTAVNARGEFTYQGAYVYDVSLENGLQLKGRITHIEGEGDPPSSSQQAVKRCGYIGDYLYTVSDGKIMINSLDDLSEVKTVALAI